MGPYRIWLVLSAAILFSAVAATTSSSSDWIVTGTELVEDKTITLAGNLIVENGGKLTLRRTSLTLNNASHGEYGVRVKSGGGNHDRGSLANHNGQ